MYSLLGCQGTVNVNKPKFYNGVLWGSILRYVPGEVDTLMGPMAYDLGGIQFAKFPLLMGNITKDRIASVNLRLRCILHIVQRFTPS